MPAKDIYHDTVKRALINDGWTITAENLPLKWGERDAYVDIGAEKLFIAEKEGRKIAVEVKSFVGKSEMQDLEKALGQFFLYRYLMQTQKPDFELFLAIRKIVYTELFEDINGQKLVAAMELKIIVFDDEKEEIVQWIK